MCGVKTGVEAGINTVTCRCALAMPLAGWLSPSYRHASRADPNVLRSLAKTLMVGRCRRLAAPGTAPTDRAVRHTGAGKVIYKKSQRV